METVENYIQQKLIERREAHLLRTLSIASKDHVDFFSNDYLGLAHTRKLDDVLSERIKNFEGNLSGATGSRLLSGNSEFAEDLEKKLALFYGTEAALIFNSGYDANMGLLSSLPTRHDSVLYDELCHASIIDGIRLSRAKNKFKFSHNDMDDLQKKIAASSGRIFIVAESIYSMDGDESPLLQLAEISEKNEAALIIDEAHATGVYGENGKGLMNELQIEKNVFARIHTFGKALACHGAVVCGSSALKEYLINFARSFIYTTALPNHSLLAVECAHNIIVGSEKERQQLKILIACFKERLKQNMQLNYIESSSPVQAIIIGGNERTRGISKRFSKQGLMIKPILSPTVAMNKERVRICLHSFNTKMEVDQIFEVLNDV